MEPGERFHAISLLVMVLCLWGPMTYFAKTRFAHYRLFWFSCAAITVVSYVLLFGSTVFFEERSPVVFDSEQENQIQENSPKEEYLYQHPLLIYKLYSTAYAEILDANNSFRTNPIFLGSVLLSLALPVAFIISFYRCWKPTKQYG